MKTEKRVTFSAVLKTVSHQGEIRYEPDAQIIPAPPEEEFRVHNFDFLKQHFELFPFGGDEYEDHVNMISVPFFHCHRPAVKKIGAVDFLKALARNPPPTPAVALTASVAAAEETATETGTGTTATLPLAVELPKKKLNPNDQRKRGIFRPKDIPGRDTPEQRKLKLIESGNSTGSTSKTTTNDKPKSILKVSKDENMNVNLVQFAPTKRTSSLPIRKKKKKEHSLKRMPSSEVEKEPPSQQIPFIPASPSSEMENEPSFQNLCVKTSRSIKTFESGSFREGWHDVETRDQPEEMSRLPLTRSFTREDEERVGPPTTTIQRQHDRYIPPAPREDPPSSQGLSDVSTRWRRSSDCIGDDDKEFQMKVTRISHERRPDPSAMYSSEEMYRPGSTPSESYTRTAFLTSPRPSRKKLSSD